MTVEINPEVCWGQPVIVGTRIPAEVVMDRFLAGDSVEELAVDYARSQAEIEDAIRWFFREKGKRP